MDGQDRSPDWRGYGLDQAVIEQWGRSNLGDKVFESREQRALDLLAQALMLAAFTSSDMDAFKESVQLLTEKALASVGQASLGGAAVALLAFCARDGVRLDDLTAQEISKKLPLEAAGAGSLQYRPE